MVDPLLKKCGPYQLKYSPVPGVTMISKASKNVLANVENSIEIVHKFKSKKLNDEYKPSKSIMVTNSETARQMLKTKEFILTGQIVQIQQLATLNRQEHGSS